jgi:hypothetical protein
MVKKLLFFLITLSLLILNGCSLSTEASVGKIISPSIKSYPLDGKWAVIREQDLKDSGPEKAQSPIDNEPKEDWSPAEDKSDKTQASTDDKSEKTQASADDKSEKTQLLTDNKSVKVHSSADDRAEKNPLWVDETFQFDGNLAVFGNQIWEDLSFKMKRVNRDDYLMTKYSTFFDDNQSSNEKVDVITIYANSGFLAEGMKIDKESMVFFIQNKELLLKKIGDQVDSTFHARNDKGQDLNQGHHQGPAGILLGLRTSSDKGYDYRTLWVAADQEDLHTVLMAEQLFFPRTSGFWELNVQDIIIDGMEGQRLIANHLDSESLEMKLLEEGAEIQAPTDPVRQIVHYVGNDYVGIEKDLAGINQLQVMPVDKLSSATVISIQGLLGEEGLSMFQNTREQEAMELRSRGATWVDGDETGRNLGLTRENGRWHLVGRINYLQNRDALQFDFDLKIMPPSNLVFYDTLGLNWLNIKDKVPDAEDAFTSPDRNLAVIKTKNKLMIYNMIANQLDNNPLAEIELPGESTVVMAEWATSSYVENWGKSFISYGAQPLPDHILRKH